MAKSPATTGTVPPESMNALLSFLAGSVLAYRRNVDGKALATHMKEQQAASTQALKVIGQPFYVETYLNKIVSAIAAGKARGTGGMPTNIYASFLSNVRTWIRKNKTFTSSKHITEAQAKLLNATMAMMVPDTATVDAKEAALDKNLVTLDDHTIRNWFTPEKKIDQKSHIDELKMLVNKVTGRKGDIRLTTDETKALKESNPDRHKRYNKLKKLVTETYQQFVRGLVRKNGGKPVKISEARKALAAAKIEAPALVGLDRLYIGEDCRLYTSAYKLINCFPPPGSTIEWEDRYDPKKDNGAIFYYRVPGSVAKKPLWAYTVDKLGGNKGNKDVKIDALRKVIPTKRGLWVTDLKSSDTTRQTFGALTELLYTYAIRIGTPGNSTTIRNAKPGGPTTAETFGLTTLKVGNVLKRSGGYLLSYPGKDNKIQGHLIKPVDDISKRVITIITRKMQGKKRSDFLWTWPNGSRVTADQVRKYLKSHKLNIKPHDFRSIRGSNLMEELLEHVKIPRGASQNQIKTIVKNVALKVGELLGHVSGENTTSSTAIKSYIVPKIISEFFEKRGLQVPQWVPQRSATITADDVIKGGNKTARVSIKAPGAPTKAPRQVPPLPKRVPPPLPTRVKPASSKPTRVVTSAPPTPSRSAPPKPSGKIQLKKEFELF